MIKFFFKRKNKKTAVHLVDVLSVALAAGVSVGLYIFTIGIAAGLGWGEEIVTITGNWYLGFSPTLHGSVIGSVWGFFDGFIGGFIFASLYNFFQKLKNN